MEKDKKRDLTSEVTHRATEYSNIFLGSAVTIMGIAMFLKFFGKKRESLFVGQWAAPLLLMGIYKKLTKRDG